MGIHSPADLSRGGRVVGIVVEARFIAFDIRFKVCMFVTQRVQRIRNERGGIVRSEFRV